MRFSECFLSCLKVKLVDEEVPVTLSNGNIKHLWWEKSSNFREIIYEFKIFDYQYTIIVNINHIFSEAFNFFSSIRFLFSSQYIVASIVENLQIKYVHFSNQSEHLRSRKTEREREKERKARLTIRLWIISSLSEALWLTMRTKQSTWPSIYMTTTFLPCNGNFALGTYGNGGETKRAPFISPCFALFHLSPPPLHHRGYRTESFGCE